MSKKRTQPVPYVQPYRYASPNIPMSAIRRFARRIAERFHPQKIILFGSYAYGTPHNESDVDLLVIMPADNVVNQAIRIGMAFERPFSFDLIVRTPKQIEIGFRDNNWFLREIIEKGKILYEARDEKMGTQSRRRLGSSAATRSSRTSPARSSVLPLPASSRKVPKGSPTRTRFRRTKDA
jgi:predicted nucleotidyltransferase